MEPNQQTPFNNQSMPPVMDRPMSDGNSEHGRKIGPLVAIIVVVLLLIIGALYLFASGSDKSSTSKNTEDTVGGQNEMVDEEYLMTAEQQEVKPVVNTSDDVQSLEADLNTATEGLDAQNF